MGAGLALQAAAVRAFRSVPDLTGVYDGAPARAAFPYLVVDGSGEVDWSTKTEVGREVSLALTLWDDRPARLHDLAERIAALMSDGLSDPDGWQLVSCRFLKKRLVRDVAGPWAAALDYRARLLALA